MIGDNGYYYYDYCFVIYTIFIYLISISDFFYFNLFLISFNTHNAY